MEDRNKKLSLIEAIKDHPHLLPDGKFLQRICDLLAKRAANLITGINAPGYEPDNRAVYISQPRGTVSPHDYILPGDAAEELLGLQSGDMKALADMGIINNPFPHSERAPWIKVRDIVLILQGEIPSKTPKDQETTGQPIGVSKYRIENEHGDLVDVKADMDYIHRLRSLFGELRDSHIKRLNALCDSEDQIISCALAEYVLGLRRGDLELLAEVGVFSIAAGETPDFENMEFFVEDLIQLIKREIFFEIKPIPRS